MRFVHTYLPICICILLLCYNADVYAQIEVNDAISTDDAAAVEFLTGKGVVILNPTSDCGARGIGTYVADPSIMPIEEGLVLTTGLALDIIDSASQNMNRPMGGLNDPDLDSILQTSTTNDKCVLEFDLIPIGDTISFNYIFASEEYPDFNCATFNDVFGFFISGPGINGPFSNNSKNIALIPGTNTPVSINTVNDGTINSVDADSSYCLNIDSNWLDYTKYYVDNQNSEHLVFDGRTVPLQAVVQVNPCDTYHLKLAIGEGYDGYFDSGVFLEKESISSNKVNVASNGGSQIIEEGVEGCFPVSLHFERKLKSQKTEEEVHYNIFGSATREVDYTGLPDSVILLPHQQDTTITIQVIEDNIPEATETIVIKIKNDVECANDNFDSILINLVDSADFQLPFNLDEATLCDNSTAPHQITELEDSIIQFLWEGGDGISCDTCLNATFFPSDTATFTLNLTSPLSCIYTDSFLLNLNKSYSFTLNNDTGACIGDTIFSMHNINEEDSIYFSTWQKLDSKLFPLSMDNDHLFNPMIIVDREDFYYALTMNKETCRTRDTLHIVASSAPNLPSQTIDSACANSYTRLTVADCGDSCFWTPNNNLYHMDSTAYSHPDDELFLFSEIDMEYAITAVNVDTIEGFIIQCSSEGSYSVDIQNISDLIWRNERYESVCTGDSIFLEAIPRIKEQYQWTNSEAIVSPLDTNAIMVFLEEPSETLNLVMTVTDTSNVLMCQHLDTIQVKFEDFPTVDVPGGIQVTTGETAMIDWTGTADKYTWTPENLVQIILDDLSLETVPLTITGVQKVDTLWVKAINDYGTFSCSVDSFVDLHIFEREYTLPTVFSPNGDGANDFFFPVGVDLQDFNLKIISRWGNIVFEMTEWGQSWDGNYPTGEMAPAGVYIWVVEGTINGEAITDPTLKTGEIILIR